jgi:SAM-dependent MidA family methyltransferase
VTFREEIVDRIEREGPMPFAAYMSLALYDPKNGYYASGATRTGWRGHFVTAPELSPAFGILWVRAFERIWEGAGSPSEFAVVEIGPAEGGFARAVLRAADGPFAEALRYCLVERVGAVADRQRDLVGDDPRATWFPSIVDVPHVAAGCFFANEVLDNLPVHLVARDPDGLKELCVEVASGKLILKGRPPSNPELQGFLDRTGAEVEIGSTYEVGLAAESLIERASKLLGKGALIFVDYGAAAPDLAARPSGSLLCYSETGVDEDPLDRPGEKDITVHANWTAVTRALQGAGLGPRGPRSQRDVLLALGAHALDESLRSAHANALARHDGASAVKALSRRQALGALLDPGGLGGLQVVAGATEGIDLSFV